MTNFYRRLMYYGLGFGIGLVGVFFFFNNRGCSWLPSNRVKEMISERIIYVSDTNLSVLKNLNIAESEIAQYVLNAEIHFSKSEKSSTVNDIEYVTTTINPAERNSPVLRAL